MKSILFLLFSVYAIASSFETRYYGGYVEVGKNSGYYNGFLLKNSSEDETLNFEFGLKHVDIADMNYKQNETFISLENEITYDSKLRFSYLNIDEDTYGGNLYALSYTNEFDDGLELSGGGAILDYKLHEAYQGEIGAKNFFSNSPFYYKTQYIITLVKDTDKNRYYNALDLEVGFIYAKYKGMVSTFLGEKRYAIQDQDCFSWNMGNLHKNGFRASLIYQITVKTLLKADYLHNEMKDINDNTSDLNVINFALSHRF